MLAASSQAAERDECSCSHCSASSACHSRDPSTHGMALHTFRVGFVTSTRRKSLPFICGGLSRDFRFCQVDDINYHTFHTLISRMFLGHDLPNEGSQKERGKQARPRGGKWSGEALRKSTGRTGCTVSKLNSPVRLQEIYTECATKQRLRTQLIKVIRQC